MAGRIPQNFVDDLLSRADIVDYIHKRVPLKKAGKNYQACCPFHDEKTPSFSVSPQKQFYYCFGCGAGGNVIGFAMDYLNLNFPEAVEQLASEVGLEVPREASTEDDAANSLRTKLLATLASADQFYRKQLKTNKTAVEYLKKRGLSGEIARDFGLGAAPEGWDNLIKEIGKTTDELILLEQAGLVIKKEERNSHYDRFRDRIIFPIRDTRGRTIAFGGRVLGDEKPKYLNSPETPVFHKSRELYGLYEVLQHKGQFEEMLVVEGYMDVIALAQQGIYNAVATLGTAVGPTHLEKLFRYVGRLIFCFDGDEAGTRAAERAFQAALPMMIDGRQVKFLFLPSGEDPDSIVRSEGKTGFDNRIESAMPLSSFLMELAGAGSELPDPDSSARAHSKAMPMINQLPRGAFRTLMEQELLKRTGVAADTPPAAFVERSRPTSEPDNASESTREKQSDNSHEYGKSVQKMAKRAKSKTGVSMPSHLIGLLLQFPELASRVTDLETMDFQDSDELLFADLCRYLRHKPEVSLSSLLGYWMAADADQAKRLTGLASQRLIDNISLTAAQQDFNETLSRWLKRQSGLKLRDKIQVLSRIPIEQQTEEQKAEIRGLMNQLRALQS